MSRWERAVRWEDTHRLAVDAAATTLLLLIAVPFTAGMTPGHRSAGAVLFAFALVAPLAWRRAQPAGTAAAVYTVALAHLSLGYGVLLPADFAVLLALYSVTVHGPRWAHRVAIAGAVVGSFVVSLSMVGSTRLGTVGGVWVFCSTVAIAVWAFGLVRRTRREAMAALVDRAHRLEIERDQQNQIATAAERSRIAREMHDIVAHSLSVIIAQSDGGRYAAQGDPDAATRALSTISETGRAALADMRRLLGVLRPNTDGVPATPGKEGRAVVMPQPAELDVESLVEHLRSSGVRVSLVRMGTPRRLPPGAGLTVYRICQEALTNVLKHAGPDPAVTVLVHWLPAGIMLDVSDDGRGAAAASDGQGQGLLGMRERAAMFGGTVAVGPRPGGGFRVRAQIPLPAAPHDDRPTDASSTGT